MKIHKLKNVIAPLILRMALMLDQIQPFLAGKSTFARIFRLFFHADGIVPRIYWLFLQAFIFACKWTFLIGKWILKITVYAVDPVARDKALGITKPDYQDALGGMLWRGGPSGSKRDIGYDDSHLK